MTVTLEKVTEETEPLIAKPEENNKTPLLTVAPLPVIAASDSLTDIQRDLQNNRRSEWRSGLVLAVISGILFTGNNFFIQYFEVNGLEILLVRSVIQSIIMGVILTNITCFNEAADLTSNVKIYSFLQAAIGGLRLYFNFTCLAYMPLGDALTIIFTEPMFTIILSLIFLKIKISIWKALLCLGLLAGMILSIQPPFLFPVEPPNASSNSTLPDVNNHYFKGAALAVGTALCGAICNIAITKCVHVHSTMLVFLTGLAGIGIAIVGCATQNEESIINKLESLTLSNWAILVMISLIGILAYFTLTESLRFVTPTTVSVLRALEIVLAYGCQVVFMGQIPNLTCILGATLVMISVIGIAIQEKL
jgi:drug/metabolite transporter (DMT)-like permease